MHQPRRSSQSSNPFVPELLLCFDQKEFSNVAVYPWENETDVGSVLVSQRYEGGETLALVFGTSGNKLLVEYWMRPMNARGISPAPTAEERCNARSTPIRLEAEMAVLPQTLRYVVEVVKAFYDTSEDPSDVPTNVVDLASYKERHGL